ncbi:sigma 54-interacting transcriptional regulator [Heyndrickxia faecalis]|nr:sigma 54-interacting transcriptional regulator [Weizmannia sp. CD-2023]MED4975671.1 sigma 54-interacting transcriptional regulator [Weizmannia sp. CD-2023]
MKYVNAFKNQVRNFSMEKGNGMISEKFLNTRLLDIVFEKTYSGTLIVDQEGYIRYMSRNFCDFLKVERNEVIGEHVTHAIENTRMHLVVKTGKAELAQLQFLRGEYVIANRIPIIEDGKILGAVGIIIFRDLYDWKKLNTHIRHMLSQSRFLLEKQPRAAGVKYMLGDLIGGSGQMALLKEKIKKVARGDITVLITGESGTGKELVAHSIHSCSDRSGGPFIKINCGAIPEHLMESELFGYEEGSFTGAKKGGKPGKFQAAEGGTVFLDEIGDMPVMMQVKLLRVLQEKEIEPVGAIHPKPINVRIIAATNQPLKELVGQNRFRKDLYYRINAVQLDIPPLRTRAEDIPLLARHFLKKASSGLGKRVTGFSPEALSALERYNWPGNIRELENAVHAAVYMASSDRIGLEDLPDGIRERANRKKEYSLKERMEAAEKQIIEEALRAACFDKKRAAKALGIGHSTLYDKMKKLRIEDQK